MPKSEKLKKEPKKIKKLVEKKPEKVVEKVFEPVIAESQGEVIKKKQRYIEGIGRRKKATARVRIIPISADKSAESGNFLVNGKKYNEYFKDLAFQINCESSLKKLKSFNRFSVEVIVGGGGPSAQSEAVRHGLARALIIFDANYRKKLKKAGYLKRDPRMRERKKYGFRGARKRPQWGKR